MTRKPHAIVRARERYGIELDAADLDEIRAAIAAGRSVLTRRDERGESHLVEVRGVTVRVVLRASQDTIVTVLPLGRMKTKQRRG